MLFTFLLQNNMGLNLVPYNEIMTKMQISKSSQTMNLQTYPKCVDMQMIQYQGERAINLVTARMGTRLVYEFLKKKIPDATLTSTTFGK